MPRLTLAHSEKFLTSVDVAPRTAITYRGALQTLADFLAQGQTELPELGAATPSVVPLNLLQDDTLAKFRHWMRNDKHYHRRTENTYLAGAVRFIEWLDANALLPGGLTSGRMQLVLRDARGRRRVGYKTQPIKEAVPLIIQYYEQHPLPSAKTPRGRRQKLSLLRNRAIVHTLFATGLRAQELASLRRSDCADGAGDKILITGKGEKERVVMLNPEAQQALRDYVTARDADRQQARLPSMQSKQDPLFIRHDRDEIAPITTKTVWQVVNDAARAGLGDDRLPSRFPALHRHDPALGRDAAGVGAGISGARVHRHHAHRICADVDGGAGRPDQDLQANRG